MLLLRNRGPSLGSRGPQMHQAHPETSSVSPQNTTKQVRKLSGWGLFGGWDFRLSRFQPFPTRTAKDRQPRSGTASLGACPNIGNLSYQATLIAMMSPSQNQVKETLHWLGA